MGTTTWDKDDYDVRSITRSSLKESTGLDHTYLADRIAKDTGVYKAAAAVDPKWTAGARSAMAGKIVREALDSDAHPESLPIAVIFDTTGSMRDVPKALQAKLPNLPGTLARQGVKDAQILFGTIDDARAGARVPLQVGQFEAGLEMDDAITSFIFEGGGGGGYQESYELAIYFMSEKTVLDSINKRGKKGYLFFVGDEAPYDKIRKDEVKELIGDTLQSDWDTEETFRKLQEKFEVFYIVPGSTSNWGDKRIEDIWKNLVGQNFIKLDNADNVCEAIASAILLSEGRSDESSIADDLAASGIDKKTAMSVSRALVPVAKGRDIVKSGHLKGELVLTGDSSVDRL